ncbi:hypothetical protein A6D96_13610 [Vibrio cyclitrophicus]|nr:hypothetical protein A6D96_13610 [Vibrio cyclitrophicus]
MFILSINRVIDTIVGHYIVNIKRVYPFQTTNVKPVFIWARTALMMRIYTAVRAEVVLSRISIKLIKLEMLSTFQNLNPIKRHRANYRAFTTTDRAIAATRLFDPVR